MSEARQLTIGQNLKWIMGITFGFCVLGGLMDHGSKTKAVASEKSSSVETLAIASPKAEADADAEQTTRQGTVLEQAILDAFPNERPSSKSARRKSANAADFVSLQINLAGHLCARPVEAMEAAPGQYGVRCVTYRDGRGRANYLVDTRTGNVDPI